MLAGHILDLNLKPHIIIHDKTMPPWKSPLLDMKTINIIFTRFHRWFKLLLGRSYYHQPQNLGKMFKPNALSGYFNDLIQKANWTGETDMEGIPVNILLENHKKVYFATTIVQKALGHYDTWLLYKRREDFSEFMKLCKWLAENQDRNGGWAVWQIMGVKALTKYSAMTQGEVMSAMGRAWVNTKEWQYKECAKRAFELLVSPIEKGGTSYYSGKDLFLEEVPSHPRNTILNGWIFALMGLYDYYLAFSDKKAYGFFRQSLETLENHISDYDTGYWSYYDNSGHLASHIYHNLHIAQLTALNMIEPACKSIKKYLRKWHMYQTKKLNYWYAIIIKGIQKIKEPGEVTLLK